MSARTRVGDNACSEGAPSRSVSSKPTTARAAPRRLRPRRRAARPRPRSSRTPTRPSRCARGAGSPRRSASRARCPATRPSRSCPRSPAHPGVSARVPDEALLLEGAHRRRRDELLLSLLRLDRRVRGHFEAVRRTRRTRTVRRAVIGELSESYRRVIGEFIGEFIGNEIGMVRSRVHPRLLKERKKERMLAIDSSIS